MHLFRPHKAQRVALEIKIEKLALELSSYLDSLSTSLEKFPYSKLHDLYDEINSTKNDINRSLLLKSLNEKVIGRLLQYNPKLFEMYQSIQNEIAVLDGNTIPGYN